MARVPELGELIADRYRIQALAREGPGYLTLHAFDRDVEVEVSILWFRPGMFPTEEARRAFLGDAVTIRGLAHPHLRRVYEAHVYNENAFATAQVGSAAAVVKRLGSNRAADELDVIRYATAIGEGLSAAHRLGWVHGYLVPSDVVEVSGQVKLTGVGLYRAASRDVARDLFWTRRRYLAPEVVGGGDATARSDVYSMGAVLAEIGSGVSGVEISEALEAVAEAHPRSRDVLTRALAADPNARYSSVDEALAELRRHLIDDRVPTAKQPAMKEPAFRAPFEEVLTSAALVIEAEEPPLSMQRRQTTQRPALTRKLANIAFDPNPISLLHADGDPMAVATVIKASDSSPWSSEASDEGPTIPTRDDLLVGDETVEIDFESSTRQYDIGQPIPALALRDEDEPTPQPGKSRRAPTEPSEAALAARRSASPPPPPGSSQNEAATAVAREVRESMRSAELSAPDPFAAEAPLDNSPATLRAMPPPAAPSAHPVFIPAPPAEPPSPRTPILPLLERPGGAPALRPFGSAMPSQAAPIPLGNYAPPRATASRPAVARRGAAIWLWAAAATVALVLGAILAVIALRSKDGNSGQASEVDAAAAALAPPADAAPALPDAFAGPCFEGMLRAEPADSIAFCIDKYEFSAADAALPQTEILFADADASCVSRGVRLCTSDEWIAACRGPDKASYPYGRRYVRGACNAQAGKKREIEASGKYPECESAVGAFDMSGNVGEWTADGYVQGGSALDYADGRCSKRYRGSPDKTYPDVGFRCCSDLLAEP